MPGGCGGSLGKAWQRCRRVGGGGGGEGLAEIGTQDPSSHTLLSKMHLGAVHFCFYYA